MSYTHTILTRESLHKLALVGAVAVQLYLLRLISLKSGIWPSIAIYYYGIHYRVGELYGRK